jgi:hypothetical protein
VDQDVISSGVDMVFRAYPTHYFPGYPHYPYPPYYPYDQHPCPSCGRCPTCGKGGRSYPKITWTGVTFETNKSVALPSGSVTSGSITSPASDGYLVQ